MMRGYRRRPTCVKSLPAHTPKLGLHDRRPGLAGAEQERRAALRAHVPEPLAGPGAVGLESGGVKPPVPRIPGRGTELLPEPGRGEELERPAELELEAQARIRHPV